MYRHIAWILFFVSGLLNGQDTEIDSLLSQYQQEMQDTTRVNLLNDLSKVYIQNDQLDSALTCSERAIELSREISFKKGEAYAVKNKGLVQYYQGNYLDVLESWTLSLEIFEEIDFKLGIANLSSNLGVVYYDQGSLARALDYYLKSLRISQELEDPYRISTALINTGAVYSQMQDYDKALNYFHQIEAYIDELDDVMIQSAYLMGVGDIYALRQEHEISESYLRRAIAINKDTPDYPHALLSLGRQELALGEREKAIELFWESYEVAKSSNLSLDMLQSLIALGDVYHEEDFDQSLKAYVEAEGLATEMDTKEELRDIYKGMSLSYKEAGDFESAYAYQDKYLELKDQVFNLETDDKIRGLQFDFDLQKKEDQIGLLEKETEIIQLREKRQKSAFYVSLLVLALIAIIALTIFNRYKYVKKSNRIIEAEKDRSENLLLNILPKETAEELKENGRVEAKQFESVTVLFTDFKGFTRSSQNLSPAKLVKSVDYYFSNFDKIIEKYGLEKIKTIGDAYMCAGGLPFPIPGHPKKMIRAATEIAEFVDQVKESEDDSIVHFDIRIGINTGPVVAGVVGTKKFAYDIWGDTVNVAARMESNSEPGRINISEYTYELVRDEFDCTYRGEIDVKNKGMMKMYFVEGNRKIEKSRDKSIEISH